MYILALITTAFNVSLFWKIITFRQMIIINAISITIMMIMLLFLLYRIHKMMTRGAPPNFPEVKVIIPKAHIEDKLIPANSDILIKYIVPTNPFRSCIFRISMEITESIEKLNMSALRLREDEIIENTVEKRFLANGTYTIDTLVRPDETINFKFDKDIGIKKLFVDELYIP